jgi:hypothetical protein
MAGLDPAIHVFDRQRKAWMPESSAGMTMREDCPFIPHSAENSLNPVRHHHSILAGAP